MINRKTRNLGVNANIGLDPTSPSSSNKNFNNNIYVQTQGPASVKTQTTRNVDVELHDIKNEAHNDVKNECSYNQSEVKGLILETYANILLNQDKALIANLISKRTIIVPIDDLKAIIQLMTGGEVEVQYDEDVNCCAAKVTFIKKIDAIKIIKDDNIIITAPPATQSVTDFKQVFNKEYNDLVNKYHLNLRFTLVC